MTLPREVLLAGSTWSRGAAQRQFLLRPDEETSNAFLYCLAEAAQRFDVEILLPYAAASHYHAVIFDHADPHLARDRVRPDPARPEEAPSGPLSFRCLADPTAAAFDA